jgi:EmrB/QacA subfamily drug resistance transporter
MTRVTTPVEEHEDRDVRYGWTVVAVVSLAAIMAGLNLTSLTTALPTVVRFFEAGPAAASWIVLSPMLVTTGLLLLCGRISDQFGRRGVFIASMALYALSALASGFSPNIEVLVALRLLQAMATAMLLANSAAIIGSAMPSRSLGMAMGLYLAAWSGSELVGPTLGGLIATTIGWRWIFWLNVPLGLVCVVAASLWLRSNPSRREQKRSLDIVGNLLFICSISGLVTALSEGNGRGWTAPLVLGGLFLFAVGFPLFIWYESRIDDPLLDLSVFKDKVFSLANASGFFNVSAVSAIVIALALYFQAVGGMSAFGAGLASLPLATGTLVGALLVGFFTRRWWADSIALWSAVVGAVGLVALTVAIGFRQPPAVLITLSLITGLGCGAFVPANLTVILTGVAESKMGSINAIRMTLQNIAHLLGSAVGLVALTTPLSMNARTDLLAGIFVGSDSASGDEIIRAYLIGFTVMVAIAVVGVVLALKASRTLHAIRVSAHRPHWEERSDP